MFDSDSRYAALKWYRKLRLGWIFNTSTFIGNFVIALVVTYFFDGLGYGEAVNYVFFLSMLSIGLWVTEAIPPFAVGIFIIATLLLGFGTDYIIEESSPVDLYVGTWTSNVIWLLLGGFFLAEGMRVVELDRSLFRFTIRRFGSKPEQLLLGLMLTTGVASMVMSNTATTAMMISSIIPLVHLMGKKSPYSIALLTGIPAAASVGGIGTIIGSTPNAIAVGALAEKGINLTFMDWMIFGFPVGIFLVLAFWKFLVSRNHIKGLEIDLSKLPKSTDKVDPFKRKAVIFTLIVTILMWLTEPVHGIPVAATSAVPIVLLTMTQVIMADQVRTLPWDTLMLVAGGLALGIALVEVGLADIVMNEVNNLPIPTFGIAIVFSLVAVLLSNVMSNTAAASILVPLGLSLPGPYAVAVPLIVAISCSCSLLLPVSTPSNAISYATGLIEQKQFRPGGLMLILLGPATAMVAVMLWSLVFV
ncbi:DASS family sodium-coupled anion symporter [Litoribacter ruber]|uniref:SLC13 family permease n=1 Tax=Litoribacter ruber TaxID=702568 RepID=UPI001BDAB77A|nr:DASS family sodium-coupled anion symporter [Litoribacter ruber]MBT0813128.1 DASS family sodium-coupled anion symporter [Litoribacter ruber]